MAVLVDDSAETVLSIYGEAFDLAGFKGHEVVGEVVATGSAVDEAALPIGQRVGIGALAGSCFQCESCISGRTNLCPRRDALVLRGGRGGFAHHVRAAIGGTSTRSPTRCRPNTPHR